MIPLFSNLIYRLDGKTIFEEPEIFQRGYTVGSSVVIRGISYTVASIYDSIVAEKPVRTFSLQEWKP